MVRRQIDFDEETDQILEALARDHHGDLGQALAELLHSHQRIEAFAEECEEAHRDTLLAQVKRAERDFREERVVTWDEIKRRNGL